MFTSSASAQTITLDTGKPSNQGGGSWYASGTCSLPADTATEKYTAGQIKCEYTPPGTPFGRIATSNIITMNTPWTWACSDNPGSGTYTLPFKFYFTKKTYDMFGNLLSTTNSFVTVTGTVTVTVP